MESKPKVIAIDGVAASGKGTLTRELAKAIGYDYLDTGAIYRLVGYHVLQDKIPFDDEMAIINKIAQIDFTTVENFILGTEEIGQAASQIGIRPAIRNALNQMQRDFPIGKKGAVLDGRDIGTVIFPDADVKFFITADIQKRAERRYKQLHDSGKSVTFRQVLDNLQERDDRDRNRATASTMPAKDAIILDTSNLNVEEVFNEVFKIVQQKLLI